MRALFLLLALLTFCLHADPKDSYPLAVTEGEPAALIGGCVSAITGDLYLSEVDAVVQGYGPLRLPRQYLSGDGMGRLAGWSFIDHLNAVYKGGDSEHQIIIQEPNGSTFVFKCPAEEVYNHFRKKKHPPKFRPPRGNDIPGLTNTSQGDISGRSNLKNASVRLEQEGKYLAVYCSDQTVRRYKVHHGQKHFKDVFKKEESKKIKYLLDSETLSSGHLVIYDYDREDRLKSIRTTNPAKTKTYASATFVYQHEHHADRLPNVDIYLSDGRTLRYRYEEKEKDLFLLKTIISPESPEESISYHPRDHKSGNLVSRISLPDLRYYDIEYYREGHNDIYGVDVKVKDKHDPRFLRVSTLKAPVGCDEKRQPTHRIFYFPDQRYTDVLEVDNTLTRYHYSPSMRLESIVRFDNKNAIQNIERFEWSPSGDLRSRTFCDANGQLILSRRFHYDERGNVIREELCGNLSGNGSHEIYAIKKDYTEDGRDLLIKEEEQSGKITLYAYHPTFSILLAKYVCEGPYIKVRTFYQYNADNVLIKEIHDDGGSQNPDDLNVKTRTVKIITPMPSGPYVDMPHVIEERYWDGHQEALLRKTVFTYTTGGQIERQDVYDALGVHRYSLHNTYDALGRIATETNPIGQVTTHTYDISGNKKTISNPSGRRSSVMHYDYSNRLVQMQEMGFDGITHVTQYGYDFKNNKTSTTDPLGNTTHYDYDCFGHLVQTRLPYVQDENGNAVTPVLQSSYDCAGREIAHTDAKGHTTTKQYNARSQVTQIQHSDGSVERFSYNLDGTLQTYTDAEGFVTTHAYDVFGRCISTVDPLGNVTTHTYDAFHLVATKDAEGYFTNYYYDGAGRKIGEDRDYVEKVHYIYDGLGYIRTVKKEDLLKISEYDLLGRITEERQEDVEGHLLSIVNYGYDEAGNQKKITRPIMGEEREEHFEYDSFDRLAMHTDAEGRQTLFAYNEHHSDGLGQRIVQKTTTDALGQKTFETYDALNRSVCVEIQNAYGTTCSFESKYYDRNSNLSRQVSTLFPQGTFLEIEWEYDNRDRLISLFEPENKSTYYTYNRNGQLRQTTKPDGILLLRKYDANGNLISLTSSDNSISYIYTYNGLNQLVTSTDSITKALTRRDLDRQGRVERETLANNLTFKNFYDLQGRRKELILPNKDNIIYGYDALHLRDVTRSGFSGVGYKHIYQDYDLSHHLISEKLFGKFEIVHTISPKGNKAAIRSTFFSQNVEDYDSVGHITSLQTQSKQTTYKYDDLYQLAEETGHVSHTYAYDSHYNRLQKNGTTPLVPLYDANGNLRYSGDTTYTYDALDRLISAQSPREYLTFTYDSFHRRLIKTVHERVQDEWQPVNHYLYLYDGQNEIGAMDSSEKIIELRVLGATPHAEIGAAIAIELGDEIYAPVHDLFGNVVKLISFDGKVKESYTYDSFGNHSASQKLDNPWRFASKRLDSTGLVYFGRRYFDPASGRWTTADPIGFQGGINLHAFVQNNPLAHVDLYGLNIHSNALSVTTPMVTTPMITTQPVAPPQVTTKQIAVAPLTNTARSSSSKRSTAKNFSVGALQGAGHCGLALTGGIASCGQIISAPFYLLSGQWSTWGNHWNALQDSNEYLHSMWRQQMQNLLPNDERLSYYPHIASAFQGVSDGVILAVTAGPTLLSKGTSFLGARSSISQQQILSNPLSNTNYTTKVLDQMRLNPKTALPEYHAFPRIVDNYAKYGKQETILGKDGIERLRVTLKGGYEKKDGSFEWIIEPNKMINHRMFIQE